MRGRIGGGQARPQGGPERVPRRARPEPPGPAAEPCPRSSAAPGVRPDSTGSRCTYVVSQASTAHPCATSRSAYAGASSTGASRSCAAATGVVAGDLAQQPVRGRVEVARHLHRQPRAGAAARVTQRSSSSPVFRHPLQGGVGDQHVGVRTGRPGPHVADPERHRGAQPGRPLDHLGRGVDAARSWPRASARRARRSGHRGRSRGRRPPAAGPRRSGRRGRRTGGRVRRRTARTRWDPTCGAPLKPYVRLVRKIAGRGRVPLVEKRNFRRWGRDAGVIGLGAWQLGADWGAVSEDEAHATLQAARTTPGSPSTTPPTCTATGAVSSSSARSARSHPDITIATKMGRRVPQEPANYSLDNFRAWTDRSRANLGVETLDLVQLHCPPTPVFSIRRGLRRARPAGAGKADRRVRRQRGTD